MNPMRRALWRAGWPVRVVALGLIRVYRVTLGGMLGGQCRFHPSCSAYAEEAIATLGAARGIPLAIWRVLRCSPLTAGGVDYPPGHGGASSAAPAASMRPGTEPSLP